MVTGVVYGMFALFLILGVLYGLKRGLTKSVIRIITVVICCVLVIFVCGPITSAILTADLSKAGMMIGDVPLTSIQDTVVSYISQISIVGELLKTSPTLLAVVNALPAVLVNLILFVVLFFILKGITYIIDIVLNKIIIKKDSDKPIRRWWGALVGGFQGLIIFLFVMLPIAGTMNLVTDTFNVIEESQENNNQTVVSLSVGENKENESLVMTKKATNVVDEYNDIFLIKMFNTIGYKSLTNVVFDKITTMEVLEEKTNLRKEIIVVAKIYNNYENLKDIDIAYFSSQNEEDAKELIDDAFSSPIIGGVTTELVVGVADAWTGVDSSPFMGMDKPIVNERLVGALDTLLVNLRTDTKEDLQTDLKVIVSTLKVSADYDLTRNINAGDADALVRVVGKDGCIENIVGTLSSGKTTKSIIPAIVEFGLNCGYDAIGVEDDDITITQNVNQINWETEKVILGDMFEGIAGTYTSVKKDGDVLETLDFVSFAKTMDAIRDSQLLRGVNQKITVALLESDLLNGVDTTEFVRYVKNEEEYKSMNFSAMFKTLESSANIANDMDKLLSGDESVSGLDNKDVSNLLEGLTTDGATKDVLVEFASSENLKKSGVNDESLANAIGGLVGSIADYDGTVPVPNENEMDGTTTAVENLIIISKMANDKKADKTDYVFGDNAETAKIEMRFFVDNMFSSDFMFDATKENGELLGFTTGGNSNLTTSEQIWLVEVLNEKHDQNPDKFTTDKCKDVAKMFGVVM